MKITLLLVFGLVCSTYAFIDQLDQMSTEDLYKLCDQVNDKKNQLWTPFSCDRREDKVDYGASGKKFKAAHPELDASTLNPVILLPGLGGSGLDAQVHKKDAPAWYCFKNHDWFRIWFAVEELVVQPCWMDNLNVSFNTSNGFYENTEGVNIRPHDFGGVKGVAYLDYIGSLPVVFAPYYASVIKSLEEIGYEAGKSIRGAPYDWRLPATYLNTIGWYKNLTNLIEETYELNGNLPVHLVTHSMGGPTALYFLNFMSQEWKDTYIASFIPIAGPWTGSPKALRAILSGDNFGLSFAGLDILSKLRIRNIARQSGGVMELVPNTDLNTANSTFVTVQGVNYTIAQFPQLFKVAGTPASIPVYYDTQKLVESLSAPNVPVHCLYGWGVPTEHYYDYTDGDFSKDPIIYEPDMGDGTVPLYSLQECKRWEHSQSQDVQVVEFNLRGHSDILKDDEFLQHFLSVITGATNTTSSR
jgi:pimeloyl-ACP methyl ester carboxylesterase